MADGNRLLCYGKMENMRDLLPPAVRKRRKRKLKARPEQEG